MKSPAPLLHALLATALSWSANAPLHALPLNPAIERELTSATGEKLSVRIVNITETQVTAVRLSDGATFLFPIERLSAEDRGFVAALHQVQKSRPQNSSPAELAPGPSLPVAKPSFSLARSQLAREQDPEKLRAALEVILTTWPAQSARTHPAHFVSHGIWQAARRLPNQSATETWINGLLSAKLNDASLTQEQRDDYIFVSLSRNARTLYSPEWRKAVDEFIRERPDSALLGTLETSYAGSRYRANRDEAKRHLEAFLSSPNTSLATAAREQLDEWAERESLGPIETWRFTAIDGREVDIGNMRGKVVLVDFWATWCGPCIKEFPTLQKLYATHRENGLEIVGIALEYDRPTKEASLDKLRNYVAARNLPWPHYADGNGWKTKFSAARGINSIPRMIIIDQRGNVIDERLRGDALVERIAGLLGEAP